MFYLENRFHFSGTCASPLLGDATGQSNAGDGCSRVGARSETLMSVELGLLVRTRSQNQFVLRQLDPVLFNDSFQTCDVL
jgi:hypothetical protein